MLKIKDNVDLKELKKFGIQPRYCCNPITGEVKIEEYVVDYPSYGVMTIADESRNLKDIFYWLGRQTDSQVDTTFKDKKGCYKFLTNLLYDLIKTDLVEKVGDDNE